MLISFLFLNKNICCGYSLEAPRRGASNEHPQHMFSLRNKKYIMWIPSLICSYDQVHHHLYTTQWLKSMSICWISWVINWLNCFHIYKRIKSWTTGFKSKYLLVYTTRCKTGCEKSNILLIPVVSYRSVLELSSVESPFNALHIG